MNRNGWFQAASKTFVHFTHEEIDYIASQARNLDLALDAANDVAGRILHVEEWLDADDAKIHPIAELPKAADGYAFKFAKVDRYQGEGECPNLDAGVTCDCTWCRDHAVSQ